MNDALELNGLIFDNTSGARELSAKTLHYLQQHATRSGAATASQLLDELADVGVKVIRSKPEMAPLLSAVNRFLREAEAREENPDVGAFRIDTVALLVDHVRRLDAAVAAAAEHAASLVENGDVVVTYSRSSTVLAALRSAKAAGKLFDVVAAESRPNLEGRKLAKDLAQDQIPVRLVVDGLLASVVDGADRVLVGADAITSTGVVNKAGTRLLALAARERGIPMHVVADLAKAWVKRADPGVSLLAGKLRDPREVWDQAPYGVEVVNLYFDTTPLAHLAGVVSEEGAGTGAEFWARVRAHGFARRVRDAFGTELTSA